MLSVGKLAIPPIAPTVVVPASVPPAGLVPIATVTLPAKLVTTLPNASSALTCTAGVIAAPASVLLGGTVKTSWAAAAGVMLKDLLVFEVSPGVLNVSV